ncbi:hypothetical protein HZC31_04480 [Candidatus Woesearchaeota archaeon]|nr:hypothetical protein [Candidatus Woesearchaeota archaeon]
MVVRGHTLTQARKGFTDTSEKNIARTVKAQSGSGQKGANESGGFAASRGLGLKKRS